MQTNFNLDKRVVASFCESHHIRRLSLFESHAKEVQKQALMLICWSSLIKRTFPA